MACQAFIEGVAPLSTVDNLRIYMSESISESQNLELKYLNEEEMQDLAESSKSAYPIRHYGTDFDVLGLVRRMHRGDIRIPNFSEQTNDLVTAGFQRGFVWTKNQMDRFVESLLLGYPVPGIFLVKQPDNKYLVLDGQQRLVTLRHFIEGTYRKKVFELENVSAQFKGLSYETLSDELRRQVDNSFIPATIVSIESEDEVAPVYQIFERLNSGGTQLTPHEIRVALYSGPFVEFIESLNNLPSWRELYGVKNGRLRDHELITRILALYVNAEGYSRPLKGFLNEFIDRHRNDSDLEHGDERKLFELATNMLVESVGSRAFRQGSSQVNAARAESIVVGIMWKLSQDPSFDKQDLLRGYGVLDGDGDFAHSTSRSTADEGMVKARLDCAKRAFGVV